MRDLPQQKNPRALCWWSFPNFPRSQVPMEIFHFYKMKRNKEIKRAVSVGRFSLFWENRQFRFFRAGSENCLGSFSFFLSFPILQPAPVFRIFLKIRSGGFQGQRFSHHYEPSVFRDGSHKSVLTNHDLPKKKSNTGLQLGMKLSLAAKFGAILSLPCPFLFVNAFNQSLLLLCVL